ncbi:MAG TPA: radical SAM protein [Deltaproteobacteria bacterium]|jgi:DNA repair photolyase|nr:radical SAM protein [Deltaproteobacteria bacterium]
MPTQETTRGRGAMGNPTGRFERLSYEPQLDTVAGAQDEDDPPGSLQTELYRDPTRKILAHNDSPDVGFDTSVNPYRGCEHGCVYCYARPTHEYLGLSAGLDFESRIFVKEDAPRLLERELSKPSWRPRVIALSGVTDPYQPAERRLGLTRRCLEVLAAFRNPVVVVTKNHLVTRDADLLRTLAEVGAALVLISLTTLDSELARRLEPRASRPERRLGAIHTLAQAGVPVGVLVAPVIPALNDSEIPALVAAAARAGARSAGYVMLRLPHGLKQLFADWLAHHYPERKDKVLHRIQDVRGGRLSDPRFGSRMTGEGVFARQIEAMFALAVRRAGIERRSWELSTRGFRRAGGAQLDLFG